MAQAQGGDFFAQRNEQMFIIALTCILLSEQRLGGGALSPPCDPGEWASRMRDGAVVDEGLATDPAEAARRARRRENSVRCYYKRRNELIEKLGGRCVGVLRNGKTCGTQWRLEFDHLQPRTWEPRRLSRWARMARYWREADAGLIQLLCRSCNARKGHPARARVAA